jgi:hypothetical protein
MGEDIRTGFPHREYFTNKTSIKNIALFTAIISLVLLITYRVALIFSANAEIAGIDNNFVYGVVRKMAGYKLYNNPEIFPYAINLYAPLYFDICAAVARLLNVNPEESIHIFRICRAVALLCDIISCVLLYRTLTKNFKIDRLFALMSVAGLAAVLCYLGYTVSRSDSLLLTFYAGFFYLLTARSPLRQKDIFLLAIVSAACLFAKQNGMIVPLLAVTWFGLQRQSKLLLFYLLYYVVLVTVIMLLYFTVFDYDYLPENTIRALQNKIDPSWFYTDIFKRLLDSFWMLPLYFSLLFSVLGFWSKPTATERSLFVICIIQFGFSFLTSFKWGSSAGYFNESFLLSCLVLSIISAKLPAAFVRAGYMLLSPLFLLFIAHTCIQGYLFFLQNRSAKMNDYRQQKAIRSYLQPRLNNRTVFSTADANRTFLKVILYKEMAVPNLDVVECCSVPDQVFDYSSLKEDFKTGRIAYIIKSKGDFSSAALGINLSNYVPDTSIGRFDLYRYHEPSK